MEGKVARVATSKLGNERVSIDGFIAKGGKGPYPNGADGTSDIEGKVAKGSDEQVGERASFNME
jgi:hypothetical protein